MRVAVLFSGGKDSTQAVGWCKSQGHDIAALIAVKPKNTEAYLWHFATVEWTKLQADAIGVPLLLLNSDKIGPREEASELAKILPKMKVDALVLGGVGLQETQIKMIGEIATRHKLAVLVPYVGLTSEELLREELKTGLDIRVTDVAANGLGPEWLGKKLDASSLRELLERSKRFGFDPLGEGGSYNTFVVDAPFFKKRIELLKVDKVWDGATSSGFLEVKDAKLMPKNN